MNHTKKYGVIKPNAGKTHAIPNFKAQPKWVDHPFEPIACVLVLEGWFKNLLAQKRVWVGEQ